MISCTRAIWRDESGATAVEYGLIAAVLVIGLIGSLIFFASGTIGMWDGVSTRTQNAVEKKG
ncbi:Flp family type IVb pilin [Croceicoccus hydrothermalis]|uniref:Flp family type IVb pilin n=1 Tax=Croceicoccus hydrothermalis TaxID=2867964 RepID=UPI001EFA62C3